MTWAHTHSHLTPAGGGLDHDDFTPVSVSVSCADGSKWEEPAGLEDERWGPVLTPEEMEDKYRLIYDKYGKKPAPNPAVNTGFVALLGLTGLAIVAAVPYAMLKRRRGMAAGRGRVGGFAAMLHASKKKSEGHFH